MHLDEKYHKIVFKTKEENIESKIVPASIAKKLLFNRNLKYTMKLYIRIIIQVILEYLSNMIRSRNNFGKFLP